MRLRLGSGFAERDLWNFRPQSSSFRLDAGELDHLGPLFGFVRDELAEFDRRAHVFHSAQIANPRFYFGIGEASVYFIVPAADDVHGRISRRADADPTARLVARRKFGH